MTKFLISIFMTISSLIFGCYAVVQCGNHRDFRYRFRPISIRPASASDYDDAGKRCSPGIENEKLCDFMITLQGTSKCHIGYGYQIIAKMDDNTVEAGDFTPAEYGYAEFNQMLHNIFKIEVCDDDSFFRGSNDALFTIEYKRLQRGCHRHKHYEPDSKHPFVFDYEICCKPIRRRQWDRRDGREGRGGRMRPGGREWEIGDGVGDGRGERRREDHHREEWDYGWHDKDPAHEYVYDDNDDEYGQYPL